MGTGKSKAAIDYANGHDAKSILIICPKAVIPVWPLQFDLHSHKNFQIYTPNGAVDTIKKAEELQQFIKECKINDEPYAAVLNYETFWRPPLGPVIGKKYKLEHPGLLMGLPWDLMVLDEIHRIKSPNGKASWGAAKIGRAASRRVGLSGTPMPHSPIDIYAQFRFLNQKIFGWSFQQFKARYCVMGGYENRQVVKHVNLNEMRDKFFSMAHRVKAEDVLDLPDHMHEVIPIKLSDSAMKKYKELEKEFVTWIDNEEVSVDNALVKLLRLSQFTSGFYQSEAGGNVKKIDSNKLDALIDKVQDLPQNEPIVIFCRFRAEITFLKAQLKKLGRTVGEISGRENDYEKWKKGFANALVVQIRSGSEGIDLTEARYVFYMSTGHSAGTFMQSIRRVLRPGQTMDVIYYHFHAQKTVDVSIYNAIQRKLKLASSIIDDNRLAEMTKNAQRNMLNDIYNNVKMENEPDWVKEEIPF